VLPKLRVAMCQVRKGRGNFRAVTTNRKKENGTFKKKRDISYSRGESGKGLIVKENLREPGRRKDSGNIGKGQESVERKRRGGWNRAMCLVRRERPKGSEKRGSGGGRNPVFPHPVIGFLGWKSEKNTKKYMLYGGIPKKGTRGEFTSGN